MALPSRGTLGQIVAYNGYNYKWTGTSWLNIGQASSTVGNTSITGAGVSVGTTSVTKTAVTVGSATLSNTGVSVGTTSVTKTAVSVGSTTVSNTGVSVGTTTVSSTAVSVGSTSLSNTGVSVGSTSVTKTAVSVGSTTVSNTGVSIGSTSVTKTAVSVGSTSISNTGVSIGSTSVTKTAVSVGSTTVSNTGVSIGSVSVTSSGVTLGIGSTITSANYTGTSNNALNLGGISASTFTLRINDRLQVANAKILFDNKLSVANSKNYLQVANSKTYLQVANAVSTYTTKAYAASNSYLNTNFLNKTVDGGASQTIQSNIQFGANVAIEGKLTVTGGISSYFANNVVTGDNMIYLNANNTVTNPDMGFAGNYNDGTYHHTGFFRDASDAGTWKVFENYAPEPDANVYINTAHATFKLAPFSARDIRAQGILSVTANTTLGNTAVSGFLKLNGTDIRATFAQNTYVKSVLANTNLRVNLINTNLTGTNTALRTLINNRMQVANVKSYLANTNAFIKSQLANTNFRIDLKLDTYTFNQALANTNAYIASISGGSGSGATWTALTSTNTALRTLISDRMQVANTKTLVNGRATWTALTSTNTAIRALVSDRLQVANADAKYVSKNNPEVAAPVFTGALTANGSTGTSGYYLRSSGTGIYWSPVTTTATVYTAGTLLTGDNPYVSRWYPGRNISVLKTRAWVITAGSEVVTINIKKNNVSQFTMNITGTTIVESTTAFNVTTNDYITVIVDSHGNYAKDLYVSFVFSQ